MLREALESLICQETDGKLSYEIVVIDDGSTDGTSGVVKEVATPSQVPVRYVHKEGRGIADARNRGIAEARGKWIAFFDDDQLAERDWLKNLLCIALQTRADCVGGTILLDLPQEQLARLGSVCRSMLGEQTYYETPTRCRGKIVPPTGNLLMARGVFDSIGLFDTSMLYGGEDIDVVARAQAAGFDTWIGPDAVVHHVIPPYRLERAYFRWVSLRWGNQFALMDCKHLGRGQMLLLCIARIGQAMLVNVPCLLIACLKRDETEALDRKCLLWRAVGYTRKTLFLLAPRLFPQGRFFGRVEFRKERETFSKETSGPEK
jgi:glycosyltransferase involved in cell wall biosynthesis